MEPKEKIIATIEITEMDMIEALIDLCIVPTGEAQTQAEEVLMTRMPYLLDGIGGLIEMVLGESMGCLSREPTA